MKAMQKSSLLAVGVVVAAGVTPCLVQETMSDRLSSTQSPRALEKLR
jgi:hypothetical protein